MAKNTPKTHEDRRVSGEHGKTWKHPKHSLWFHSLESLQWRLSSMRSFLAPKDFNAIRPTNTTCTFVWMCSVGNVWLCDRLDVFVGYVRLEASRWHSAPTWPARAPSHGIPVTSYIVVQLVRRLCEVCEVCEVINSQENCFESCLNSSL